MPGPGAQVFAIGVNYRDHATEAGIDLPEAPMVFTKFPAAVTGPYDDIALPSDAVDFEVELVAVIGPARSPRRRRRRRVVLCRRAHRRSGHLRPSGTTLGLGAAAIQHG